MTSYSSAGCAPLMSDGRLFTNWTPRCTQVYLDQHGTSSYDLRQTLIQNATTLMKQNAGQAYVNARCSPCYENPDWNTGTMLPELHMQTCDARTCTFVPHDKNGLGLGRQYWNPAIDSEYKKKFIENKEKEQQYFKEVQANSVNPFGADYMPF